jgi:hypothetical protein
MKLAKAGPCQMSNPQRYKSRTEHTEISEIPSIISLIRRLRAHKRFCVSTRYEKVSTPLGCGKRCDVHDLRLMGRRWQDEYPFAALDVSCCT